MKKNCVLTDMCEFEKKIDLVLKPLILEGRAVKGISCQNSLGCFVKFAVS